jgi:hypothetical protein
MLSKLKEYKEFISILLFFMGGYFWIDNQFPKKDDLENSVSGVESSLTGQVKVLECLLDEYMTLTQLQIRAQDTEKEIDALKDQLIASQPAEGTELASLSPAMIMEREELTSDLKAKRDSLTNTQDQIEDVSARLLSNSCRSAS